MLSTSLSSSSIFSSRALISPCASSSASYSWSSSFGRLCSVSGNGGGDRCLGVGLVKMGADHGKIVGMGQEADFFPLTKWRLHIRVCSVTVKGFLIETSHWWRMDATFKMAWKDKVLHSSLSLLLLQPGMLQCLGVSTVSYSQMSGLYLTLCPTLNTTNVQIHRRASAKYRAASAKRPRTRTKLLRRGLGSCKRRISCNERQERSANSILY